MKEKKYYVAFNEFEHGLIIRALNEEKTRLIQEGKDDDAVNDLIIKIGTAPLKNFKVLGNRTRDEAR